MSCGVVFQSASWNYSLVCIVEMYFDTSCGNFLRRVGTYFVVPCENVFECVVWSCTQIYRVEMCFTVPCDTAFYCVLWKCILMCPVEKSTNVLLGISFYFTM